MIFVWLWTVVTTPIDWLLGLMPEWSPVDFSGFVDEMTATNAAGGTVFALFRWANTYLPVAECLAILALVVTVWAGSHIVGFVSWLLSKLHITGGD